LIDTIALRAIIGISIAEVAPKLVIMTTGDRVLARVVGALGLSIVGTWLAWASRAGAHVEAAILALGSTAAWLAITAGRPHWQAAMLTMRAAVALVALWLAAHVDHPRMAYALAIVMCATIAEVALAYAFAPGGPVSAITTIGQAFGPWASSVVPAILVATMIWAALDGRSDRR